MSRSVRVLCLAVALAMLGPGVGKLWALYCNSKQKLPEMDCYAGADPKCEGLTVYECPGVATFCDLNPTRGNYPEKGYWKCEEISGIPVWCGPDESDKTCYKAHVCYWDQQSGKCLKGEHCSSSPDRPVRELPCDAPS
jgi:hypothetical protein